MALDSIPLRDQMATASGIRRRNRQRAGPMAATKPGSLLLGGWFHHLIIATAIVLVHRPSGRACFVFLSADGRPIDSGNPPFFMVAVTPLTNCGAAPVRPGRA